MADDSGRRDWDRAWRRTTSTWFESPAFLDTVVACFTKDGPIQAPALDVGCGRGALLERLRQTVSPQVFGADFSRDSLGRAPWGCVQADAGALPFHSGAFNSVLAVLLVEHLPDYRRFLAEAHRLLLPGGRLHLVFPNRYSLVTPVLFVQRRLLGRRELPWHRPLGAAEAAASLREAGFAPSQPQYLSIGPYRRGVEKLASRMAAALLPACCREEVIITGVKP